MTRTLTVAIGIAWAVLSTTLLGTVLAKPAAAQASPKPEARASRLPTPSNEARPPLVVVRPIGPIDDKLLRHACRSILRAYPMRCEIRTGRSELSVMPAWNEDREQLDARKALDILFRDHADDAVAELHVTALDIYETRKPYVFGLASLTDRVALVSLARIDNQADRVAKRLQKLVLHEVAHTMGLHHHEHRGCVMRQDPTARSLDTAPEQLCDRCHAEMLDQSKTLTRPGQVALDWARGHLVRGEADVAREALIETLWSGRYDLDVLHAFGVSFYEAKQFNEAISVLRFVISHDPERADSHVNLGLAYQMRGKPGDRHRAIASLEQALQIRPDWDMVATHLADLSDEIASAQGPQ